jgi:putative transposase
MNDIIENNTTKHNPMQSLIKVWIHLVWTTKNREPCLHKELKIEVCKHILENAKIKGYQIDFINGVEDHLHCLVKLNATSSLSRLLNDIKGESSHWINQNQLTEGYFDWQDGYGAFSVSPSQIQKVRNYIKNQEEHHQKQLFEEEMKFFENLAVKE